MWKRILTGWLLAMAAFLIVILDTNVLGKNLNQENWIDILIIFSPMTMFVFLVLTINIVANNGSPTTTEPPNGSYIILGKHTDKNENCIYLFLLKGKSKRPYNFMLSFYEYPELKDCEVGQKIITFIRPKTRKEKVIKLIKQLN